MKPHGAYKLSHRGRGPEAAYFGQLGHGFDRCQRIVDSLRDQILAGGPDQYLRIRQVFAGTREIYRVEIQEPGLHYRRTTLLDHDALEELLQSAEVRQRVVTLQDS